METADRNIIESETQQPTKLKMIETQTSINEPSSVQEDVTQLETVITKTIENNNENVKEVERELEKIVHERKEATEKVILTNASLESDDDEFVPIVETFSEDDTIVIKPKSANTDERPTDNQEHDYVIEDNTIKNGKKAMVTFDADDNKQKTTASVTIYTTTESDKAKLKQAFDQTEPFDASNESGDDSKDIDDVTISVDGAKVRHHIFHANTHNVNLKTKANRKHTKKLFESSIFLFQITQTHRIHDKREISYFFFLMLVFEYHYHSGFTFLSTNIIFN